MAVTTKTNGTVQSVERSGTARKATVRFPVDPPPPDYLEFEFECSVEDYQDFRAALLSTDGKVDVDADYTASPPSPTHIKIHK